MKFIFNIFVIISFLVLLTGCGATNQSIYHWDASYIDSVYESINEDGDINEQISNLEKVIQDSYNNKKKVAPGLYAQLGLLYSKVGNNSKSIIYLNREVETFPESKQYIDFLKNKGKK
jgi:hypothetical protein